VNKISDKSHDNDGVVNCHTCRRIFPHLVEDIVQNLKIASLRFYLTKLKQEKENRKNKKGEENFQRIQYSFI
jgi:hypothetical protein